MKSEAILKKKEKLKQKSTSKVHTDVKIEKISEKPYSGPPSFASGLAEFEFEDCSQVFDDLEWSPKLLHKKK